MRRDLNTEEKRWCLEQAIAIVKGVGHGGAASCAMPLMRSKVSTTPSTHCTRQSRMMCKVEHRDIAIGIVREEGGTSIPPTIALTGIEPVSSA
jgi:hypothetical protein